MLGIDNFIWGTGLSEHAWQRAQATGAAWVGNNAAAHISLLRSTVAEELAFGMEQRGMPREVMQARVEEALDAWGLRHVAQEDPMRLSTGQTRRLAIAQALLTNPGSLVLDCPLDGLDATAVRQLARVLAEFPGEVTVYDRVPSILSDAAEHQFQLQEGGELVPQRIPAIELPASRQVADTEAGASAGTGETLLSVDSVRVRGLGPFSLEVRAGEIVHLAGANGSGKTSLLLAALGLVDYEGTITAPRVGWAPTALDESFLHRRVIDEVGGDWGVLKNFGLEKWAEEHPLDVPTSERRLVLVAAAMVGQPSVVFLDEPTVGLDGEGHRKLLAGMREYVQRAGASQLGPPAVLWTCHDHELAAAISDRSVTIG